MHHDVVQRWFVVTNVNGLILLDMSPPRKFSTHSIENCAENYWVWAGNVARMGKTKNAYNFFSGKHEGKKPLGRTRRK